MEQSAIQQAAEILGLARLSGKGVAALPEDYRPTDEASAYDVQDALHTWIGRKWTAPLAGWKLGCTTPVMQALVGLDGPAYGGILLRDLHHGAARLSFATFQRPGVECEIALRLAEDLPAAGAPFDRAGVAAAVGAAMAAIELVDNRYGDFEAIGTPTLIADDFFQAACVLGPEREDWRELDLAGLVGRTYVGDGLCGLGRGAAALGHPLDALAWLANAQAECGRGLFAGEIVLTGSLVATRWIDAPVSTRVVIDQLGEVRLDLA